MPDPNVQTPSNSVEPVVPAAVPAIDPAQSSTPVTPVEPQLSPEQQLIREMQSKLAKTENELRMLQYRPQQVQVNTSHNDDTNPYDPNTDFMNWWQKDKELTEKRIRMGLKEEIQSFVQSNQERQWAQEHGGVDIDSMKNFTAQELGIPIHLVNAKNLEVGWAVYQAKYGVTQPQVAPQRPQQFTPTMPTATPLGAGQPVTIPGQISISYEQMLSEYNATHGKAYNTWDKPKQELFDREAAYREAMRRQK